MITSYIAATGSGLPERTVSNEELAKIVEGVDDQWVQKRTGIKERRVVLDGMNTSDLATMAAKEILDNAGISPEDVQMIVVSSITPDYETPSVACMVQKNIGADTAFAFDVRAACSGFVYALSAADKFIKSGACDNVLVIGAEALTKGADWNDKKSCILFGDGAGGVLLKADKTGSHGIIDEELGSIGKKWEVLTNGFTPAHNAFNNEREITPEDVFIKMDGLSVFSFATKKLRSSITNILTRNDLTIDDIDYIVPHQANAKILDVVARKLGTSLDKFYLNIDRFANTSSASIPIALNEMDSRGLLKPGMKLICAGFGGGLTWGTMLIEL
ncbi:MAG: beta-ketoacyl-ACP synthase III [Lachnospiraceae bacterium]|jgi:3-oxoacyl-[acyl-carrier-protein] synthase-3|nr:beta-ketoacyl-ACP synthase III [Lachnospiraceae bacterium]MEE3460975.1 beta-ketoacyl-ACP synthase III [Lachnospiraceae bacterium]